MRKLLFLFYLLGVLFWLSFFLYDGVGYLALKHLESEMVIADTIHFTERGDRILLSYSYSVESNIYTKTIDIPNEYFDKHFDSNIDLLSIIYCKLFPQFSFVKQADIELRRREIGIIVSVLFLLFINALYWFSNKDRWVALYSGRYRDYIQQKNQ